MSRFKIGDIVITHSFVRDLEYNGVEAVIVEEQKLRLHKNCKSGVINSSKKLTYLVKWPDGLNVGVKEVNLKLKKPPQEYKGENRIMELFLPNNKPVTIEDIEESAVCD